MQPETGWQSQKFASFSSIVNSLIAHRMANPALVEKHGWATDQAGVEDAVDAFNARVCVQMGWTDYVMMAEGESPPPKSRPPSQSELQQVSVAAGRAKKIWAGVRTLNDWLDSNEPPVEAEVSSARAAICAKCPKNTEGDFTKWFTKPAAGAITKQIERVRATSSGVPE